MAAAADTTRDRLITTAEALFAAHGIEGVSLREITRASGARNAVALQYHFADRAGLVRAVVAKHQPAIDAERHGLLDRYVREGRTDLRSLAEALVRPLATKLSDRNGGPEYLQIYAELVNRLPVPDEPAGTADHRDSVQRWRALVEPLLEPDATRLHRRYTAIRITASELGRRAASGPHTDDRLFVSHLIDLVTAVLSAPVSDETRALADDRDAKRPRRARPGAAKR
jgi:AcrR family transcriptional regulator